MTSAVRNLAGELRAALNLAVKDFEGAHLTDCAVNGEWLTPSTTCDCRMEAFLVTAIDRDRQLADDYDAVRRLEPAESDWFTRGRVQELTVQVERALRLWAGGGAGNKA